MVIISAIPFTAFLRTSFAFSNEEKIKSPADDLINMKGMDSDTAKLLASKSIITMEDLADLAADELIDIVKMDEERAKELIMTARKPWFENEETANESSD